MQANRPLTRSAARFAVVLALTLGALARPARAQDIDWRTRHVLPPDSAGFLNRARVAEFRAGLPSSARPMLLPWEILAGPSYASQVVAGFDAAVSRGDSASQVEWQHQRLLRRLSRSTFAVDTVKEDSRRGLFGLSANTADVSFDGLYQAQISTTRQRNLACTAAQVQNPASGCRGGFAAPRLDNTVTLRSTGVFAQRFHVNIDFDSKRDYAANNIISAYYQGLEDEKLQRVDIGTVQFRPPPSRFLTASIPLNNFGISAEAQFGAVRVQGIAATQKGSVSQAKHFTIGGTVVEPQDQLHRDLDYEAPRLFWVVNPRTLAGYPNLDVLNASNIAIPPADQPTEVRIYRYIAANQTAGVNANYDGVTASGVNGTEQTGALRWRLLRPNIDYWLDPSGLWFIMATGAIDPRDYLAVSYKTRGGATVGTFPLTDNPAANDQVSLVYLPNRTPTSPIFYYEMRQAYKINGSSLVRSSLRAAILVANSERPITAPGTYLSLLGLAVPANQATLDVDNRVFPRQRDPGASAVVKDALLIFPTTQPFSNPSLTDVERNDSLYVTPDYLLLTQGPPSKFQIHLQFDAQGGGDRSSVTLDAVQITEGSEHVDVNGRVLTRGTDYTMDYATGRVLFLDPNALFGNSVATVTVTYEQQSFFAQAPTSIAGLTATWNLGNRKTISFVGLYQSEATGYNRPQLGYEARASLLLGVVGDATWNTPSITRFFNRFETKRTTAPSQLSISGEFAVSRPDPNRSGDAYLEEFENDHSVLVSAGQNTWHPGSVPQSSAGLESVLPQGFDSTDAVQLIWQNLIPGPNDTLLRLSPSDIDSTIVLTASKTPTIEPVMWMTLHADTAGGILRTDPRAKWSQDKRPGHSRWRTMTTALSPTGVDLSRNDYFEFALYEAGTRPIETSQMRIVLDLGKVSEDALSIAPTTYTPVANNDTTYHGRQYIGVKRLDTEKTFFGTWSATADDNGILADRPDSLINTTNGDILHFPALCQDSLSATIHFYPWGDLGSRCSRHNGAIDTEDLDGDNLLDAQGANDDIFRYIVDLNADSAKYFVRSHEVVDSNGRSARWTIYRVPLRTIDQTIGSPDIHLIKQLRMAFVVPPPNDDPIFFALALMKFTGAAWVARAPRPIATLSGPIAEPNGAVVVGSVSTQDSTSAGYSSPPGIGNVPASITVSQSSTSQQINEKSLRIQAFDLQPGQRAEGYTRLPSGSQNLLAYRQLRVWTRGAPGSEGWNDNRLQAYVKVGSDAFNFYLYRAPARTTTWDPEMVIDLQVWQDLRAQIEDQRLHGNAPSGAAECGGDPTAYVACEGNYLVQVRDPLVNPPNLAAVQELAAGVFYAGTGTPIPHTELWVDDIRVGQPVATAGYAGTLNARLIASDVGTLDVASVLQTSQFHLMGQSQSYQNIATVASAATVHLEKFLSPRLGLYVPVTVSTSWGWVNPELLSGTDVQAGGLTGLRRPRNDVTTWSLSVVHPAIGLKEPRLNRLLFNALSFSAFGSTATNITSLSDAEASNWSTTLSYNLNTQRRAYGMRLRGLTRGLPRWLRESVAGQGIANASFAPWPTNFQLSSSLSHSMGELQSFSVPITVLADTILKPVTSEQFLWRNSAGLTWQPFTILNVSSNWVSTRDLRVYDDSTTLGRVVNASHQSLFGTDVGVERDRNLTNQVSIAPRISSWLSPSFALGTNFVLSRSLTTRNPVRIDGDTAGAYILPQTLNNSRYVEYRVTLDPRLLTMRIFGDSSHLAKALVRFRPISFLQRHTLESTFDLATFNPGLDYQLALGGLDGFLSRSGQDAIGGADAYNTSITASIDLPAGFSAQAAYSSTSSDRYQHRVASSAPSDLIVDRFLRTTGTTRSWPSGRFHWQGLFANGPVTQLILGSTLQRDVATSFSPFEDGSSTLASSETQRFSPDFTVAFRNGITVTLSGEVDHSNAAASGNLSQTKSLNLTQVASWNVRLPRFLSGTRRTLQTSISVSENTNSSCIQRTADTLCVPYYDLRRLDARAALTAQLQRGITTGIQFGYVHNDVRSLGALSSTINIGVVLTVPLAGLGM